MKGNTGAYFRLLDFGIELGELRRYNKAVSNI